MPEPFVNAVATATGRKQRVPRSWLDHPTLGRGLKRAPSQKHADDVTRTPSEQWTDAELTAYADANGIDLDGATVKADILAAINNPSTQTPDDDPSPDETLAAGGDEGEN